MMSFVELPRDIISQVLENAFTFFEELSPETTEVKDLINKAIAVFDDNLNEEADSSNAKPKKLSQVLCGKHLTPSREASGLFDGYLIRNQIVIQLGNNLVSPEIAKNE